MNGVEILKTIYEYESLINPIWGVALCMIGIAIALAGMCTVNYDVVQRVLLTLAAVVIVGMVVCIIGAKIKTDTVISTQYKVTIDDSVSMNEFLDKYEILDQEGKIYTVKERE